MKHLLIYVGAGFVFFQILLVLAVCAAAKKPTPEFKPGVDLDWAPRHRRQGVPKEAREFEIV